MAKAENQDDDHEIPSTYRIRESGNALVVTLDRNVLAQSDLEVGDEIVWTISDEDNRALEIGYAADVLRPI